MIAWPPGLMVVLRVVGTFLTLAGGAGAGAATAGHPDLTSVAALITSLSGVLATVGGLWLARQRKGLAESRLSDIEAERDLLLDVLMKQREMPPDGHSDLS